MIPPALLSFFYRLLAYAAIAVALYGFGRFHQAVIEERARDAAEIAQWRTNDEVMARLFGKLQGLADRHTVDGRLNRLCERRVRRLEELAGAPRTDPGGRGADEGGRDDELDEDLLRVQRNRFRCEALQDEVRPQLRKD